MFIEMIIDTFKNDKDCKEIIVVLKEEEFYYLDKIDNIILVNGGSTRFDSVKNGLSKVSCDFVMIHDGARPFINYDIIKEHKEHLILYDACVSAISLVDSIKRIDNKGLLSNINRNSLMSIQTPQSFKSKLIIKAYNLSNRNDYTDDACVLEDVLGILSYCVKGDSCNYKITNKEDL